MKRTSILLILIALACSALADSPETVAVTYRVSKTNEAALEAVIQQHWATAQRLKLVSGERRLYRGDGFFLEIFTWRDAAIPDAAPPEIRKLWAEMERLVKKSDGVPGIHFEEVHAVAE